MPPSDGPPGEARPFAVRRTDRACLPPREKARAARVSARLGEGAVRVTVAARDQERGVEERNRRTAFLLLGWIVFLMIVSLIVIWVRN